MNKEENYRNLAGNITAFTDNTMFYEDWLVIQQYVDDWLDEIEQLQQENQSLKEKVLLLQASEPMLEFAKQTYETYWETLKQLLIDKFNVTQDTIYLDILTDLMKPIEEKEVK